MTSEHSKHVLAKKIRKCVELLNQLLAKARDIGMWVSIGKSTEDSEYHVYHIVEHETREY